MRKGWGKKDEAPKDGHRHSGSSGGKWRNVLLVAALVLGAVGTTTIAVSALTGNAFEGADGNLTPGTGTDWSSASVGIDCVASPKVGCAIDKPTGQTDDSFGNGTAENDPVPTVTDGSIPNNKSDLTRFYVATTKGGGKDFLNLAWERVQEPSGTTNMDFEFNQSAALSSNGVTPVRTAGDLLIKYDLSQGGTNPVLGRQTWITTGADPGALCEAGNKLPCWAKVVPLSGAVAEGSVNPGSVTDPINPGAPRSLSARTFGEASINLTDVGLFPAGSCVNFGSAYLKSRSSDSFTAAVKDFIAPIRVSVTNCGRINIHKQDDAGAPLAGAGFTLFNDAAPLGGSAPHGAGDLAVVPAKACTTDTSGNCFIENVPFGQYWLVETTVPSGHTAASDVNVVLTAVANVVNQTIVDPRQPARLTLHKQDDLGAPLAGAVFTLYVNNAPTTAPRGDEDAITTNTCISAANGDCVFTSILPSGNYWIVETTVPAGYAKAADRAITLALGDNVVLSTPFVDSRLAANLTLHKQDDLGAPLAGAVFTLYRNSAPTVGPRGGEDTVTAFTCTSQANGDCAVTGILPAGDYWIVETTTPAGYFTAADRAVSLALGQSLTIDVPFVDPRKPASITLHKQDDTGAALAGAGFTLYTNNAPTAGARGNEDTVTTFTCTSQAGGDCVINNILPAGNYWIVETNTPSGYTTAAEVAVSVALGQDLVVAAPFVDARKFTIIVLVCSESDGKLYPSTVTVDGVNKTSAASAGADPLCATGGASYTGKPAGNHPSNVNIP
jgi:hypothetical protein